ncbi:hypothetical protein [Rhizobium leguminosarum]|nr:hypothetical protein [Rhizobium leguminosarum]
MTYKSILLNLGTDGMVAPVIKFGVDLARRFDARLIGIFGRRRCICPW